MTLQMLALLLFACGDRDSETASPVSDTQNHTDTDTDTAPIDQDNDGHNADEDCDDSNDQIHPGASEQCNGIDDNCDDIIDASETDADGDGQLDCTTCADAGFWPETLAVTDDSSLNAAFRSWMPQEACADYQDERDFLFGTLDATNGQVEGIYTGAVYTHNPSNPDWDTVNTEHVWPRSDGAEWEPVECDLHHLFPADAYVNGLRGDRPFGIVDDADWQQGGSSKGTDASGADVFEPRDAKKGDIARAILYIAARYPSDVALDQQRSTAQISLFAQWSAADPPDEQERLRSQQIAARQGHANPFVVCPDLVTRISAQ